VNDLLRVGRAFSSPWPAVLEEMLDYVHLQLMLAGAWQTADIHIALSRQLLTAEGLLLHVGKFQKDLEAIPRTKVVWRSITDAAHRVDLDIWRS
jgi:hypothetical protein